MTLLYRYVYDDGSVIFNCIDGVFFGNIFDSTHSRWFILHSFSFIAYIGVDERFCESCSDIGKS